MSDPLWINAEQGPSPVGTATISAATDEFTIVGHGLIDADRVTVTGLTGGAVGPLTEGAVYYVVSAAADTFQVSEFLHGTPVDFASDGGADVSHWRPAYNARELRRAQGMFVAKAGTSDRFGMRQGIHPANDPVVSLVGTTWTVHDLNATVYPGITDVSGGYVVQHQEESGSTQTADGSQNRIDALDLQIQDDDEDSSTFRRARVVYAVGAPAGVPAPPALTVNSLRLATILVSAGGSPAPVIDELGDMSVATGGILPVRTVGDLPASGRYEGLYVDVAEDDTLRRWNGSTWQVMAPPPTWLETEQTDDILGFTNTTFFFGSPAAPCGQTFIVPPSGQVFIEAYCLNRVNTFNTIYVSWSINDGTSVGGTEIVAPSSSTYVYRHVHEGLINSGVTGLKLVTGLTPGQEVTAWVRHRVSGGNGDLYYRRIVVIPQP